MSFRNLLILAIAVRRGPRNDMNRPPEFHEQRERGLGGHDEEEHEEIELVANR
jgi:hypothetical protein